MPDVNNEELLRREMAKALKVKPSELEIEESPLASFRAGDAVTVSIGQKEWTVVGDNDTAEAIALAVVKQDLEDEPEIFNQSFIESHIDTDKLRQALHSDVMGSNLDRLFDEASRNPQRFVEDAENWIDRDELEQFYDPETGDIKDIDDVPNRIVEKVAEAQTEKELEDPMSYLEDISGREDAVKQAIEIAGIDIDKAAEEAVDTDGWQHFLARYDGNSDETPAGFVFWRDN